MSRDRVPVLLVESGRRWGGTERVVDTLARGLDRERFDPWAVLEVAPELDRWADDLRRAGVPVERRREIDHRLQWLRAWGWYRFLRRHRDALLHVHHVWPSADKYLVSLARRAGVRGVVITDHLAAPPHSSWQRSLKRWEKRHSDANVAVSRAVAGELSVEYDLPSETFEIVPNGVDAPPVRDPESRYAYRARRGFERDEPVYLFVGRLEEQKGIDVLLDAWARLDEPRPRLVLVGEGSLRPSLEARAAELGVTDVVEFVGESDEVGEWYAACDGLVMPSRFEGMPLVLLEAMMAGLPILATQVGGIAEATDEGRCAALIPPEDPDAVAQGIENWRRHPEIARALGRCAAEYARATFGRDRMVARYQEIYERVLAERAVPSTGARARSEAA